MNAWLEKQLTKAKGSILHWGVERDLVCDADVHMTHGFPLCRAYCVGDAIYVAWWYVVLVRVFKREGQLQGLLRHELAHVIVQWDDVRYAMGLPDYFERRWDRLKAELAYVGRGFRNYGGIHPEEAFAEEVRKMTPRTMLALAAYED